MGFADDIMQEFMAAHPEAALGRWSEHEFNQSLQAFIQARNKKALVGFDGLSAEQMHVLLNNPFSQESIIRHQATLPDDI